MRGDTAFAARFGFTHRQDERCSRLRISDVVPVQQTSWIDEAPGRDAGYRIVGWSSEACPDELIDAYATALEAMNYVPLDEIEFNDERFDAPRMRARGDAWRGPRPSSGRCRVAVGPDGSAAGITELFVSRHRPQFGHQGDTGVVAAHRGHQLGRWLKADNLRLAPGPPTRSSRSSKTYNAESNPWMLAINVEMGFAPHRIYQCWQGSLAHALELAGGSRSNAMGCTASVRGRRGSGALRAEIAR